MNINDVSIIIALILSVILIVYKIFKLKKEKQDGNGKFFICLGIFIFSMLSIYATIQAAYLAYLTFQDKLTQEIIIANKNYIFLAWIIFTASAFYTYVQLFFNKTQESNESANTNRTNEIPRILNITENTTKVPVNYTKSMIIKRWKK
jgi:NADH:ubiquinone oxidoreductase subunit 5 (subunit L)/multisubunit Na+/H+ antiporter MnhA subunit